MEQEEVKKNAAQESWRPWLEFVQVVAVLGIGAAILLLFAGDEPWWRWGAAGCFVCGLAVAVLSPRLVPRRVQKTHTHEITDIRIAMVAELALPPYVVMALQRMCVDGVWKGTAATFESDFLLHVGPKRGAEHAANVLPYLAVYDHTVVVESEERTDVAPQRLRILDQPLM
jgi:hypothetical protein